jgi:hypothetical protein
MNAYVRLHHHSWPISISDIGPIRWAEDTPTCEVCGQPLAHDDGSVDYGVDEAGPHVDCPACWNNYPVRERAA